MNGHVIVTSSPTQACPDADHRGPQKVTFGTPLGLTKGAEVSDVVGARAASRIAKLATTKDVTRLRAPQEARARGLWNPYGRCATLDRMLSRLATLGGWSFVGAAGLLFVVIATMVHGLWQFLEERTGARRFDAENGDVQRTHHVRP
jgi:hypothetical protein